MNFKLENISLYKANFQYKIIIENGNQKIQVLITSPKNNIRFQWKNFVKNFPLMSKDKKWLYDEQHHLWHAYLVPIKWTIVLKIL